MVMDTLVDMFKKKMDLSKNSSECVNVIAQNYFPFTKNKQGIMMEILNEAAKRNNFCYNLKSMLEGSIPYGTFQPANKTYNGMLGLVHRGEYESILDPMAITQDHLFELEISTFLYFDPVAVLMPYPDIKPNVLGFLLPFSFQMWVAIICSVVIVAMTYFILTFFGGPLHSFSSSSEQRSSLVVKKLFSGFQVSLQILLGQDIYNHGIGDTRLRIRLLVCVWLFAGFIISQSFKCNLKSMLIKPKIHLAFNTLEEMVNQKEIQYFTTSGTVLDQTLKTSRPESLFGRINMGLMKETKPGAKLNMLQEGKYAFIAGTKVHEGVIQQTFKDGKCALTIMQEELNILRVMGLYFHKGSKFRDYFNYIIVRYRESGIYQFLNNLQLYNAEKCKKITNNIIDERALSLQDYYGVFALYLAGLILSFLAFLGESIIFYMDKNRKTESIGPKN